MRPVLPICLALVLASSAGLHAQAPANAKPAAAPETLLAQNRRQPPVATPIPMTPAPKKKGFLERVFGGREKTAATPAPAAPVATPAPATPRPRPKRRPAPAREETPEEKPETETAVKEPVKEAAVKKPTKPKSTKTATKEKEDAEEETEPKEELTAEQQAVKDAEAGGDPGAIEKAKYDEVKSRALQDEKILALKEKADAATDEDEGRKALRAYNKALFQKMRTMDSSIRERVDLMEDAVMKRLEPAPAAKN